MALGLGAMIVGMTDWEMALGLIVGMDDGATVGFGAMVGLSDW